MSNIRNRMFATALVTAVVFVGGIAGAGAAVANEPVDLKDTTLADFRANLAQVSPSDVAAFDLLSPAQRTELAEYLLGESVSPTTPPADAQWTNGVAQYGDFTWSIPSGQAPQARTANVSGGPEVWATQWFSFAGIKIIEVKNSLKYTKYFGEVTGVTSYSCRVTLDIDLMADVTSVKENAFVDGPWAVESQCKVSVKRGVPTPWGTVSWSTVEDIHFLRADNTGAIIDHGWK